MTTATDDQVTQQLQVDWQPAHTPRRALQPKRHWAYTALIETAAALIFLVSRHQIRIAQRERRLFRALHTGDPYKVLRQLQALERRYEDLAEPYGKTRAFAIDMP